jgi:hypothetical protein
MHLNNIENIPKYLLLELEEEIPAFEQVVCGITMPTVDMNACLEQIFDIIAISEETVFNRMLSNVADYMGKGEGLYENARLDDYEKDQIILAVIKIGHEIKTRMKFLKLELDGFFPYSFKKLVGKNIVVLCINEDYFLNTHF